MLIAPRVALTAAHCVSITALGLGATFSLFLGSDLDDAAQLATPENTVDVERTVVAPECDLQLIGRGHDLAVVVLAQPVTIAPLTFEPPPSLEGVKTLRALGYGVTAPGAPATGAGLRREAEMSLRRFDALFLELGSGPSPCLGDSGGPAFVRSADGSEQLAGLVSFTNASCSDGAMLTNLSAYLPFIRQQLAEVANEGEGDGSCRVGKFGGRPLAGWLGVVGLLPLLMVWRRRR